MTLMISCLAIFINEDLEMQRQRKHGPYSVAGSEPLFSFYSSDSASQRASLAVGSHTGAHGNAKALLSLWKLKDLMSSTWSERLLPR